MNHQSDVDVVEAQLERFADVRAVIDDPIRFKLKLGIGEDAYTSLRLKKNLQNLWDLGGAASGGATFAGSQTIAAMFFSPAGWLARLGIGATATTPVGWIIAGAVVSAGAYYGVTRLTRSFAGPRTRTIPNFINTPIDLLATSLFDLLAALAVKIAYIDGEYHDLERAAILTHFVEEWGYSPEFLEAGLTVIEENADDMALNEIALALAELKRTNPDCNYGHMTSDLMEFLREIALADHREDERESLALEKVDQVLRNEGRFSISRQASQVWASMPSLRKASH